MTEPHLASFTLSSLALGSLAPEAKASAEAHLASCERCRGIAAEMQADRDRFSQSVFPRTLPTVQARASARWWSPSSWKNTPLTWLVPAGVVAAAAAVALILQPSTPAFPDLSTKGGPTLQVFAKRGIQVFAVQNGTTLAPGDQLRFAVEPGDFGHLLIVSLDGAGHGSVYYPFGGHESGTVTPQSRSELPGSVTLDATQGDEVLFALFSKNALSAKEVLEKLEREKPKEHLEFDVGAELSVTFHKAAP